MCGRGILEFSNSRILEFCFHLPARLGHSGDLAVEGELPEAEAANSKLTQKRARAAAAPAAVAVTALQLRRLRLDCFFELQIFRNFRGSGHRKSSYCRNGIPIWRSSASP